MAMDIRPASALRTEYNELAARSRTTGQPIYITRNGEGDTVLMALDAFTRQEVELDRREAVLDHRAVVLGAACPVSRPIPPNRCGTRSGSTC